MEELKRLAAEYYSNTVSIKYFGYKGAGYLLLSMPFLLISVWLNLELKANLITMLPMMAGAFFWSLASKEYNLNLIKHLKYFTHLDSKSLNEQKASYLHTITFHISPYLFETMQSLKEVIETNNKNRNFILDNGWYHFFKFIYDSESKNRILSLLIYLISLIAIITVIKPELDYDINKLIYQLNFDVIINNLLLVIFLILLGYALLIVPLLFFITFIVVPLMLTLSSNSFLCSFFISELNKYAFTEGNTANKQINKD